MLFSNIHTEYFLNNTETQSIFLSRKCIGLINQSPAPECHYYDCICANRAIGKSRVAAKQKETKIIIL